ncbi:MAG: amylo-alpha-1,6-glucosidase [Chloroflexi bacterium]|nr:amylo-alpha-1,6-glucosidase [Chloroflexota bacterium]
MEEAGTPPRKRPPLPEQTLLPEAEPMAVQDIRDALVIRERDLFLLTDVHGEVPSVNLNGYGLYYADTRYLSAYEFTFADARPVVLLSTGELGYSGEQVLTNPTMTSAEGRVLPRGTIEVRRQRVVEDVLEETLRITSYNVFPVTLDLHYTFRADFADIFEVRGYERTSPGQYYQPRKTEATITFAYKGVDGRKRETRITFSPAPLSITPVGENGGMRVSFRVSLRHRESAALRTVIAVDGRLEAAQGVERFGTVAHEYDEWLRSATNVYADNDFFNAVLQRSLHDLRMLWNHDTNSGAYPAAGTPWFDTLFGRDVCIVSLQTLAFKPEIARQCLKVLARWQGTKFDPWRDEEPGKILHELRNDELTVAGELPYSPYYGSVDSTPLFLWLAGQYYAWTADLELMAELEPNLRAALQWIEQYGDVNSDGFVEYEKRSAKGLVNQGWKDSGDSIIHTDGTLVEPPIALVEVQGYVYAAKRGLAPVFAALGDEGLARRLLSEAAALKRSFNREFWLPEGFFALALDGQRRPAATITSNPGHALWTGIASRGYSPQVVERLMRNDMFSGWGIRTLSTTSARFNPFGYHLGTVWPHDNSILAMGFKKYGFEEELSEVATALFDAARAFPLVLQAMLGLHPDAPGNRLTLVRPRLPSWLGQLQVERLRVGRGEADLLYERRGKRTRVRVIQTRGNLTVDLAPRWPL